MTEAATTIPDFSIAPFASILRRVRASDVLNFEELHGDALGLVQLGGFGPPNCLGEYGNADSRLVVIDIPCLHPLQPVFECWKPGAADVLLPFEHGEVSGRMDGSHLFARLSIDDSALGMRDAARQAYCALFAALDATHYRHILKVWNYLPAITEVEAGEERYRSFNVGRFDAIRAAGREAQTGAPAACALGTPGGGRLQVHVIAGREAPHMIENPRQVSAYHYPSQYGRRSPNFSRAALTRFGQQWVLLISGTASIVGHESLHGGDVRAQTREVLVNLGVLVQEANASVGPEAFALDELACTVYVRQTCDMHAVQSEMASVLGEYSIACREAVILQADICRSELLVEIEATGIARCR